jgi:hypothetical protein
MIAEEVHGIIANYTVSTGGWLNEVHEMIPDCEMITVYTKSTEWQLILQSPQIDNWLLKSTKR